MTVKQFCKVARYSWIRIKVYACGNLAAQYGAWSGLDCLEGVREDFLRATVRDVYGRKDGIIDLVAVMVE